MATKTSIPEVNRDIGKLTQTEGADKTKSNVSRDAYKTYNKPLPDILKRLGERFENHFVAYYSDRPSYSFPGYQFVQLMIPEGSIKEHDIDHMCNHFGVPDDEAEIMKKEIQNFKTQEDEEEDNEIEFYKNIEQNNTNEITEPTENFNIQTEYEEEQTERSADTKTENNDIQEQSESATAVTERTEDTIRADNHSKHEQIVINNTPNTTKETDSQYDNNTSEPQEERQDENSDTGQDHTAIDISIQQHSNETVESQDLSIDEKRKLDGLLSIKTRKYKHRNEADSKHPRSPSPQASSPVVQDDQATVIQRPWQNKQYTHETRSYDTSSHQRSDEMITVSTSSFSIPSLRSQYRPDRLTSLHQSDKSDSSQHSESNISESIEGGDDMAINYPFPSNLTQRKKYNQDKEQKTNKLNEVGSNSKLKRPSDFYNAPKDRSKNSIQETNTIATTKTARTATSGNTISEYKNELSTRKDVSKETSAYTQQRSRRHRDRSGKTIKNNPDKQTRSIKYRADDDQEYIQITTSRQSRGRFDDIRERPTSAGISRSRTKRREYEKASEEASYSTTEYQTDTHIKTQHQTRYDELTKRRRGFITEEVPLNDIDPDTRPTIQRSNSSPSLATDNHQEADKLEHSDSEEFLNQPSSLDYQANINTTSSVSSKLSKSSDDLRGNAQHDAESKSSVKNPENLSFKDRLKRFEAMKKTNETEQTTYNRKNPDAHYARAKSHKRVAAPNMLATTHGQFKSSGNTTINTYTGTESARSPTSDQQSQPTNRFIPAPFETSD